MALSDNPLYEMRTNPITRVFYIYPNAQIPKLLTDSGFINEIGIEVEAEMLECLIEDKAVIKTKSGRFEFTQKGKDLIREAPDPD